MQWLRLHHSTEGGKSLILVWELRSHMPCKVAKKNFFIKGEGQKICWLMYKGSSWDEGSGHSWTLNLPLLSVFVFSVFVSLLTLPGSCLPVVTPGGT